MNEEKFFHRYAGPHLNEKHYSVEMCIRFSSKILMRRLYKKIMRVHVCTGAHDFQPRTAPVFSFTQNFFPQFPHCS